jgi:hypothetical protein
MFEHNSCHHRYLELDENIPLITEDGMCVFISGGSNPNFTLCGHIDFPMDMRKVIDLRLREKRSNKQASNQL